MLAPPEYGCVRLIAAFAEGDVPLVWVELSQHHREDPTAQGEAFAASLHGALGVPLLAENVPYPDGVSHLQRHLRVLGPLTIALSGAHHAPEFAQSLLNLQGNWSRVILAFNASSQAFALPKQSLVLGRRVLRVTLREAAEMAAERLLKKDLRHLWRESGGAYETFLARLHETLRLPVPAAPTPHTPTPREEGDVLNPDAFLNLLMKKGRWLEALELAVKATPGRAAEILEVAGHAYHQGGLHQRLWQLLREYRRQQGSLLYWKLVAASRLGRAEELRGGVERYLTKHEAPELRALYAGTLAPVDKAFMEAKRARRAVRSPHTLYQYGCATTNTEEGVQVLRESVALAEGSIYPYEVVRNAGSLAGKLVDHGSYRAAAYWGAWALEALDTYNLGDVQHRLELLITLTQAHLLSGTEGHPRELLREGVRQIANVPPPLARRFRAALADCLVAGSRADEALRYYYRNWRHAERSALAPAALGLVRGLLYINRPDVAIGIAERGYYLTKDDHECYHRPAVLAYGLALGAVEAGRAVSLLEEAYERYQQPRQAPAQATASLHLAKLHLTNGDPERARALLLRARPVLEGLSHRGLKLLSGPEGAFREVWSLLGDRDRDAPLELRLLGQQSVWLSDTPLDLPKRWQEIIALLALNPEGLSVDRLLLLLDGDHGSRGALQTTLSRLRKVIPLTKQPVHLAVTYRADFLEVRSLLERGRLYEAAEWYQGPLLAASEAPGIVEARAELEESFRQAALHGRDADALYRLAEVLGDDLELWEATLAALPRRDSRAPLVQSRIAVIRKNWEL